MGVPVPTLEPAAMAIHAEAAAARAEASLYATDASLRSLSLLLLAARGAAAAVAPSAPAIPPPSLELPAVPLAALARPRGLLTTLRSQVPLPPPLGSTFRPLPLVLPPLLPPPLAPASDIESESDWADLPSLLADSPHNQSALDDLLCPWGPCNTTDQFMRHPRGTTVLPPSAFRTSFFGDPHACSEGLWAAAGMHAPRRGVLAASSATAQPPLDAELSQLAGKLANLMRMHRQRLGTADPHIRAGLQDVANELYTLSNMLQAGMPPPA